MTTNIWRFLIFWMNCSQARFLFYLWVLKFLNVSIGLYMDSSYMMTVCGSSHSGSCILMRYWKVVSLKCHSVQHHATCKQNNFRQDYSYFFCCVFCCAFCVYSVVSRIPSLRRVFQLGSIDFKGTYSVAGKIKHKYMKQIRTYKWPIVGGVAIPPWEKQVLRVAQTRVSKWGLLEPTAPGDKL